jgi:hypothetical protein
MRIFERLFVDGRISRVGEPAERSRRVEEGEAVELRVISAQNGFCLVGVDACGY